MTGCDRCERVERLLGLLADHLSVRLDVLEAKAWRLEHPDQAPDERTMFLAECDPRTGRLPRGWPQRGAA